MGKKSQETQKKTVKVKTAGDRCCLKIRKIVEMFAAGPRVILVGQVRAMKVLGGD